MIPRKFELPTSEISGIISNFTISFVKLSIRDGIEDAVSAGSGTLVTVGSGSLNSSSRAQRVAGYWKCGSRITQRNPYALSKANA